jgi:hypothetical protein
MTQAQFDAIPLVEALHYGLQRAQLEKLDGRGVITVGQLRTGWTTVESLTRIRGVGPVSAEGIATAMLMLATACDSGEYEDRQRQRAKRRSEQLALEANEPDPATSDFVYYRKERKGNHAKAR